MHLSFISKKRIALKTNAYSVDLPSSVLTPADDTTLGLSIGYAFKDGKVVQEEWNETPSTRGSTPNATCIAAAAALALCAHLLAAVPASAGGAAGSPGAVAAPSAGADAGRRAPRPAYTWPTGGPAAVLEGFNPPAVVWGSGHRDVDLALTAGSPVLAAGNGTVVFAGMVAGRPVVSIDHADGIRTTYEPVEAVVGAGGDGGARPGHRHAGGGAPRRRRRRPALGGAHGPEDVRQPPAAARPPGHPPQAGSVGPGGGAAPTVPHSARPVTLKVIQGVALKA